MIDFEKIGKRILEERKYLHRISQEKMALDLGMYQADISNLEKAKKGSGISDLYKLDLIADYFDIPLETLLFGRRQDKMEKYYGSKMQLKPFTGKMSAKHQALLRNLTGAGSGEDAETSPENAAAYQCGPYMIYEARAHKASAVLLICSILDAKTLGKYIRLCDELELTALVEAHDKNECDMALGEGARVIGVNNRNLRDFTVDPSNCLKLREYVGDKALFVAESGVKSREDIEVLEKEKVDAVLIGESMMRAEDKTAFLKALKGIE